MLPWTIKETGRSKQTKDTCSYNAPDRLDNKYQWNILHLSTEVLTAYGRPSRLRLSDALKAIFGILVHSFRMCLRHSEKYFASLGKHSNQTKQHAKRNEHWSEKYQKPFAQARYKRKSQAAANGKPRIILCTSREIPKKVHKTPRKKNGYRRFRALSIAKRPPKTAMEKETHQQGALLIHQWGAEATRSKERPHYQHNLETKRLRIAQCGGNSDKKESSEGVSSEPSYSRTEASES